MRKKQKKREARPETYGKRQSLWNVISLAGLLLCAAAAVWGYRSGYFHSVTSLQRWMERFGGLGVLVFILIQIVQVVFPILPGGISCLAGVLLYGPWVGFLYNYVGICIGSMAAFGIARNLGRSAFEKKFSPEQIRKFEAWTGQDSRFLKLFAAAIFFPVAPDDLLCYLAGTTAMTWKQFICIIWLGKPCSIALYSLGLTKIFQVFFPAG
ncbi:MAG: TVP38/TMEM64 family protein [Ruminococcus sp.]|jgi:uncharacterized membrane protein YdjX (TVP38/TMEM64 family)